MAYLENFNNVKVSGFEKRKISKFRNFEKCKIEFWKIFVEKLKLNFMKISRILQNKYFENFRIVISELIV